MPFRISGRGILEDICNSNLRQNEEEKIFTASAKGQYWQKGTPTPLHPYTPTAHFPTSGKRDANPAVQAFLLGRQELAFRRGESRAVTILLVSSVADAKVA